MARAFELKYICCTQGGKKKKNDIPKEPKWYIVARGMHLRYTHCIQLEEKMIFHGWQSLYSIGIIKWYFKGAKMVHCSQRYRIKLPLKYNNLKNAKINTQIINHDKFLINDNNVRIKFETWKKKLFQGRELWNANYISPYLFICIWIKIGANR